MERDTLSADILANQRARQRQDPEYLKIRSEMDKLVQEDELAAQEAKAAAAEPMNDAPSAPQKPKETKEDDGGSNFFREAGRAVAGGAADAVSEVAQTIDEAATWLDNNVMNLRVGSDDFGKTYADGEKGSEKPALSSALEAAKDSVISDNESTAGKIGRSLVQFMLPFMGAMKAMKGIGAGSKLATAGKATVAGAAVDAAAFDPHEKRASNLIMELTENDPVVGKAVFEYLQADPSDSSAEGRLKNLLEGAGLGIPAEGLALAIRAFAKTMRARHGETDLSKVVDEASAEYRAENPDEFAPKKDAASKDVPFEQRDPEVQKAPRTPDAEPQTLAEKIKNFDPEGMPAKAPRTPDPEGDIPAPRPPVSDEAVNAATEAVSMGNARKMWYDPDAREFTFSQKRPAGSPWDFDKAVGEVLAKTSGSLSGDDLEALRAYRDLQESAFPGDLAKSADAGRPPAWRPGQTITDAMRRSIQEEAEDIRYTVMQNAEKIKQLTEDPRFTGKGMKVAAGQEGFASPTMLANIASAGTGAAVGAASVDDDASVAERLQAAGLGALAGLGVKVGVQKGAQTLKALADSGAAKKAEEVKYVQKMVSPELKGIVPKVEREFEAPTSRPVPKIKSAKVDEMVKAMEEGRIADLARAVEDSDFNFANIDSDVQMEQMIDAFSKVFEGETLKATGGVKSLGDINKLAQEIGAGPETLKALYKDTGNLAARVTAHRMLLAASAEHVTTLAKFVVNNPGTPEAILSLRKHVALHASIQTKMKGIQTEVARTLGAFRLQASSVYLARNETDALLQALGGVEANKEFAKKLSMMMPGEIHKVAQKAAFARTEGKLYEAWVNGILSGMSTHVVNAVGNSMVTAFGLAEKSIASVFGMLRHGDDYVRAGEVRASLWGMTEGIKDALRISQGGVGDILEASRLFATGRIREAEEIIFKSDNLGTSYKAFATDTPLLDNRYASSELDQTNIPAWSSAGFGLKEDTFLGKAADYFGAALRTPGGRLLTTADEFFKTMLYRGELRAQAFRQASSEGLQGDDFVRRVAGLLDDPTPDISTAAMDAARRGTFTTPLGTAGAAFTKFVHAVPGLKFIAPFIRTPLNILSYVAERTPLLNLASSRFRADWSAGGARRDMAKARLVMGGVLYTSAFSLAQNGMITGGGEKQRAAENLAGQQKYSIKVGEKYYSFHRLDPIGMFFGLTKDILDLSGHISSGEADKIATAAVLALQQNLVDKSYVKGIMDVLSVVNNPEMYGERFIQRFMGSWVPSWSAQFARQNDPMVKEIWSVVDAMKARIPGLSESVPNHVNLLGEEIKLEGGLGPDIASPVYQRTEHPSPFAKEIARLNVDLRHPPRTLAVEGTPGVDLEPLEYHRLMILAGAEFKKAGEREIQKKGYQSLPESNDPEMEGYRQAKNLVIQQLWYASLKAGKAKLLQENRYLAERVRRAYKNKAAALRGRPLLPINQN